MSFESKFRKLLREDDLGLDLEPDLEKDAMVDSLDDDVSPDEFDVDMEPDFSDSDPVADAVNQQNQQMVQTLSEWESRIEEFLGFLNSDSPDSMQSQLAQAAPETVMDKVKQSQQVKIARVASDLAALQQSILGFKAQSSNSKLKGI